MRKTTFSFRQDIGQISTGKVFFITENLSVMKNVTNFHRIVETGVNPMLA